MYGIQTEDEKLALASALSYWIFRCRDKTRSPANGLKTWEYLQSSIINAAIPSRSVNDYIETLTKRLIVPHLNPNEWMRIISNGEILDDSHWVGWENILESLKPFGVRERHIIDACREKSHIVATLCRVRHEQDRSSHISEIDTLETLDAEFNAL